MTETEFFVETEISPHALLYWPHSLLALCCLIS